jgi:hypothetical protein
MLYDFGARCAGNFLRAIGRAGIDDNHFAGNQQRRAHDLADHPLLILSADISG